MNRNLIPQAWSVTKVFFARLRFLAVFLIVGFIVGYWDNIKNHWDKWTRPAVAPDALAAALTSDIEYFCVMHPNIIRSEPGNCPICGMPLLKRKKGEKVQLPQDVLARVQLSPQRIAIAGIQTSAVQLRELLREIEALGVLDYNETKVAQLSVRVAGRADELFIRYTGQTIKNGDPIYSLYSPELYSAQREYLLARRRVNELPAAAPESAKTDAATIYNASMEKLVLWGVTQKQLDEMDREYDSSGKIPSHLTIVSPISGVVIRKDIFEGGYVNVGEKPYTIADLSTLWLQVKLYERDVPLVQLGQPVAVTVDALPDLVFNGVVTFKAFQLDPQTRTVDARVEVKNADMHLTPGMFANAAIQVSIDAMGGGTIAATAPATQPATRPSAPPSTAAAIAEGPKVFTAALDPYLQVQALLAQDKFQDVSQLLHAMAAKVEPLKGDPRLAASVTRVSAAVHDAAGQDLEAVRNTFKEVSAAMIEIGKSVGLPADAPAVQVYRCPMAKANWLQPSGATANPFYGSSMFSCGGPVEPLPKAAAVTADATTRPSGAGKRMLAIPRSAVIEAGRHRIVYVESSPGVFDMRAVTLGPQAGEYYPVLRGLEDGERVVTVGAFLIDSENRLNPALAADSAEAPRAPAHQH